MPAIAAVNSIAMWLVGVEIAPMGRSYRCANRTPVGAGRARDAAMICIALRFGRCGNRAVSKIQLLPVDNLSVRITGDAPTGARTELL